MRKKRDKDREKELFEVSFGEVMASTDMFSCARCGKRDCRCERFARVAAPPPALQHSVAFAQRVERRAVQKRLFRYHQKQTRASDEPMTVLSCPAHIARRTSHVTRHTSHVTRHASHVTRHTSHVMRHTSHVTRHASHVRQVFITCNNCGKPHETNHCPVSYAMRHRQNLA